MRYDLKHIYEDTVKKKIGLSGEEANIYKFMTGKVSVDEMLKYVYDNWCNDVGNSKYIYDDEIQDRLSYRAKVCLAYEGVDIFMFYKDKMEAESIKSKKQYPEIKIIKYFTDKYNVYIEHNPEHEHYYGLIIDPIKTDLTEIVKKIKMTDKEKFNHDLLTQKIPIDELLKYLYDEKSISLEQSADTLCKRSTFKKNSKISYLQETSKILNMYKNKLKKFRTNMIKHDMFCDIFESKDFFIYAYDYSFEQNKNYGKIIFEPK